MLTRHKRLLLIAILILVVVSLFLYSTRKKPVSVSVYTVDRGVIEETVANTRAGTVKPCRRAQLAPSTGGQISSLPVKEGDRVKAGEILLALWSDDLQAEVKLAQSETKAARDHAESVCVQAENAERAAKRKQALRKNRLVSEEELEHAVAQAESQAADCKAANTSAQVSAERVGVVSAKLERTMLRAPFEGVVVEVNGEIGEYVTPSPPGIATLPVVDMIDRSCFYVLAPIDEVDVPQVRQDMPARISLDAFKNRRFPASVRRISDYVLDLEKQARTVDIEVSFDNAEDMKLMLPGYSADAEVILRTRDDVVRIPTEAVIDARQVYVLDQDSGILELRDVQTGLSNWDLTEITEGLEPGEQVVTSIDRKGVEDGAYAKADQRD